MGFASMFEEIQEKIGFDFLHVSERVENMETNKEDSRPLVDVEVPDVAIPKQFSAQARSILQAYDVPSYLVDRFVDWIYERQIGRKSIDMIWGEFVREAIPLLTQHLSNGDPVTHDFVRELFFK